MRLVSSKAITTTTTIITVITINGKLETTFVEDLTHFLQSLTAPLFFWCHPVHLVSLTVKEGCIVARLRKWRKICVEWLSVCILFIFSTLSLSF